MSGGGGGGNPTRPIGELRRLADEAVTAAADEAGINAFLQELLRDLNARDTEEVRSRLDEIFAVLVGALEGTDQLLFGGSVAKHTYCDGLSDVDALLLISQEIAGTQSPADVRTLVAEVLRTGLADDVESVRVGNLAVTVEYRDGREIQLLPAVRRGAGFEIADASGTTWTSIRPRAFAEKLSSVNALQNGLVVRAIKLAKSLIAGYAENRRLTGYHIESLAIEAFEGYTGPKTLREVVKHFFRSAGDRVLRPIVDSTGQSIHVDDHLGIEGSVDRLACADSLRRTARRLESARTIAEWRAEFGS